VPSTPAEDDVLLATGAMSSCVSTDGVYDMSGNAREWTNDPRYQGAPTPPPDGYTLRGGAFDTPKNGLTCSTRFAIFPPDFAFQNVGFRCCSSSP